MCKLSSSRLPVVSGFTKITLHWGGQVVRNPNCSLHWPKYREGHAEKAAEPAGHGGLAGAMSIAGNRPVIPS